MLFSNLADVSFSKSVISIVLATLIAYVSIGIIIDLWKLIKCYRRESALGKRLIIIACFISSVILLVALSLILIFIF